MTTDDFVRRLKAPPDRWGLIRSFVAQWHAPLEPGQGYGAAELEAAERRLGFPLPAALREWYELAGRRADLTASQDHLWPPSRLELEKHFLFFHIENQGCCSWGLKEQDLVLADPPVFLRNAPSWDKLYDELTPAAKSVSEFALHMLVQETVATGPGPKVWTDQIEEDLDERLRGELVDLGFPSWHWPNYPRVLLATPGELDVLVDIIGEAGEATAVVAAPSRKALDQFTETFDTGWEPFSEDEEPEEDDDAGE